MKTATASILRALPMPVVALAVCFFLLTAIVAAMEFTDRGPAYVWTGDEPFSLSITRAGTDVPGDPMPCEELPSVMFALPVHLPTALRPAKTAAPAAVTAVEDDRHRFLQAIAQVESRGNPRRVGRLGERGLYQFRQGTWRQHTREHFSRAHHPGVATAVALRHYEWIRRQLRDQGRQGSPYEIALAWNAGVTNVLKGRAPARAHSYAQRVVNLSGQS